MTDFLRLWCEEHERNCLARARAARQAYEALQKGERGGRTRYGQAVRRIARAHEAAAAAYRAELEMNDGEETNS